MDFIKDKKQLVELINELISNCGTGKEIAETLDYLIFDYLRFLCVEKECLDITHNELFFLAKELRDLFLKLETI